MTVKSLIEKLVQAVYLTQGAPRQLLEHEKRLVTRISKKGTTPKNLIVTAHYRNKALLDNPSLTHLRITNI